jgi:endonuclease III
MAGDYTVNMARKTIPSRARARPTAGKKARGGATRARPKRPARHDAAAPKVWTAQQINEAFRRFQAAEPEPRGELVHTDPYTLLVAVVLSAQATDAGVNKATRPLFAVADTPAKMVALGEERLREAIKTIGLYVTKAKNVIGLSQQLLERHHGMVPHDRAALEALPGVGRKSANVVLNTAFGEPTIAVDTHVFRLANRLAIAPGRTPREVEDELMRVVPKRFLPHAHHWLILHGRYVCKARQPRCGVCVLVDLCPYEPKNLPGIG